MVVRCRAAGKVLLLWRTGFLDFFSDREIAVYSRNLRELMSATMKAAVHLGQHYQESAYRLWAGHCSVRGVSWSEVATVPKRKSHRGLDLDLSLNSEVNIRKGWKENGGTK